jgi:hypothetical protein
MIAGYPPFYGTKQEVIKSIMSGKIEYLGIVCFKKS